MTLCINFKLFSSEELQYWREIKHRDWEDIQKNVQTERTDTGKT